MKRVLERKAGIADFERGLDLNSNLFALCATLSHLVLLAFSFVFTKWKQYSLRNCFVCVGGVSG